MASDNIEKRIEDYGLIGNTFSAALIDRSGTMDWLCLPRFDSPALFASLLGNDDNGAWKLYPRSAATVTRRYRPGTAILETSFATAAGKATIIDFMPVPDDESKVHVVRLVRGDSGTVDMATEIRFRFDYGHITPWLRRREGGLSAIAGPDGVLLHTPVEIENENFATTARFSVSAGETIPFVLTWFPSHRHPPLNRHDPISMLEETESKWRQWIQRCEYQGPWREQVARSLITLKALTYHPTGGIVAAPSCSLPERIGGTRNWDYRYCWVRDATFTIYALLTTGFVDEAILWRDWLMRAAAGDPSELQIMYGLAGERRLPEYEINWLSGFAGSRPVRIGNLAHTQRQIDIFGELFDTFHATRRYGVAHDEVAWPMQRVLIEFLEKIWREPDEGIWEIRGEPRHFVHSKVMAWVAFDRAVKAVEEYGCAGPVERWRKVRQEIHDDVCAHGFDSERNCFTQYYGSEELDAALLLIGQVGFLSPNDPRYHGTIQAIERELMQDGLVRRYSTASAVDGIAGDEGAFLACSFWLCDAYALCGRYTEARALFERLVGLANDLGLLAEEYDPAEKRLLGNFPQAFSHIALINAAHTLTTAEGAAHQRAAPDGDGSSPKSAGTG
ncbi:MAG TPA: glycoside hydrolase family 15 protein [Alphaproteobacteria bacterium]|nr:glycoside hydrolase family 15 protein [Alphaproteobacteria bacterium]